MTICAKPSLSRLPFIALLAAIVLGSALRLIWLDDIEYKADEAWTFEAVQRHAQCGEFMTHGMPTSQNVLNPGMSVWINYPLAFIFGSDEPTQLARGVGVSNILALVLLLGFIYRFVPRADREIWLWALALVSLNPHAMVMARKIWPPCILPPFIVLFLGCWWRRNRTAAAFGWGLLGQVMGQIHLSAFFYVAALTIGALWQDRRAVRWRAWIAGNALGLCLMLPALVDLAFRPESPRENMFAAHRLLQVRFWSFWFTEPFSLGLDHYLHHELADFLAGPTIDGQGSFLNAAGYVLCLGIGFYLVGSSMLRLWSPRCCGEKRPLSQTSLLIRCACLIYGMILTLTFLPIHRHYLLVTFPVMFLWAARLALPEGASAAALRRGRIMLAILCCSFTLLSWQLLSYIHENQEAPGYGKTYNKLVSEQQQRPPDYGPPGDRRESRRYLPFRLP
jgi:4-amino-4-deoxy-L-arabinose transferase-like glycosyltransferase